MKTLFKICLLSAWTHLLVSCGDDVNQNVNMTVTSEAADGLDLKAVTEMLKTVKDPAELEKRINSGDPRICNLDLNEDDTIDYVKVTEYESGQVRGISLTTELGEGDVQELATIEITEDEKGHRVQTHGNSHIYGRGYYYHSHFGVGDYLMFRYMFGSHPLYVSSWGYNRYPGYYSRSRPLERSSYRSKMSSLDSGSIKPSKTPAYAASKASPNQNRSSDKIKAPLRAPTASQKSFQKRNPSRAVKSGGFGSRSGSSSGSFRSSSRSGSSFGGGK